MSCTVYPSFFSFLKQEQSDHLPLKRNAGVGVDMDAEDEQNSLSEISNLSMQKASENVCSSLICEGGYNGQCTMVPRSEVYDATYNSTNSIDARSCNLQSTSLKETYQLCPTDSSGGSTCTYVYNSSSSVCS